MNIKITSMLVLLSCILLTSCIKQKDLYEGGEEKKNDYNKPGYLYPFHSEVQNATVEITIQLHKKVLTERLNLEIPPLKYNKSWLLMLTQDDCKQAAFCRTWAAINGRPVASSSPDNFYYDIAHLQNSDLPPGTVSVGKTLGTTDSMGNEVRFAITTTLAPEWGWMHAETDVNPGFTDNYYRFYMKAGLIWNNVIEMLNFGTGIAFHDVQARDVNIPSEIREHYAIAQDSILKRLSGRGCKMLAEPNGNKTYVTAAMEYPDIQTMTAQAGTEKLYPFQVQNDLQKVLLHREFNDSPDYFKNRIKEELRYPPTQREAISIGVHNTDNAWVHFLKWVNDQYGKDGDDSVWFPSQEEYYEYNYYRIHGTTRIEQIDERTLKLTVTLPGKEHFYYPSVTVNVGGIEMENIASISSNDAVTGLSYGNFEDGITMNIDCRKFLAEHAEQLCRRV